MQNGAQQLDEGIRKAAILVAGLDRRSADAVLDSLGEKAAERVRQAVVEMDDIDPREQRRVIDEFSRIGPKGRSEAQTDEPASGSLSGLKKEPAGVELDDSLARKLALPPKPAAEDVKSETKLFEFLNEVEDRRLADVLACERPQVIASVLSQLSPKRAGQVLAALAPAVQADVARRLVHLEETDVEVLRDVERVLKERLAMDIGMQRRRVAGLRTVAGILEASDDHVGACILDNLTAHDRSLAERLHAPSQPAPATVQAPATARAEQPEETTEPTLRFDDLTGFESGTLARIFAEADPEVAMAALFGAPPMLMNRIMQGLSPNEAAILRTKLNSPGPIRLSDVDQARRQIAALAERLTSPRHNSVAVS